MDMDVYFGVDDLLDLSNDDIFTSSISTTTTTTTSAAATINITTTADSYTHYNHFSYSDHFNHDICVPNDEIAELEWLSNFVDDSFSELTPAYSINAGTTNVRSCSQFNGCSRSTKSTANPNNDTTISNIKESTPLTSSSSRITSRNGDRERLSASSTEMLPRKCTHCSSEKTPQWRAGPLGPKTLCNACGVRYKSGRLVPEYRPASSPTFVLTQHSNSHRKVLELRRQKELLFGQQQQQGQQEEEQQQQQEALYRTYTTSQAC